MKPETALVYCVYLQLNVIGVFNTHNLVRWWSVEMTFRPTTEMKSTP